MASAGPITIKPGVFEFYFEQLHTAVNLRTVLSNSSSLPISVTFHPPKLANFEYLTTTKTLIAKPVSEQNFYAVYIPPTFVRQTSTLGVTTDFGDFTIPVIVQPAYTSSLLPSIITFENIKDGESQTLSFRFEAQHGLEYPFTIDDTYLNKDIVPSCLSGVIPATGHLLFKLTYTPRDDAPLGRIGIRGKGIRPRTCVFESNRTQQAAFDSIPKILSSDIIHKLRSSKSRLSSRSKDSSLSSISGRKSDTTSMSFSFSLSSISSSSNADYADFTDSLQLNSTEHIIARAKSHSFDRYFIASIHTTNIYIDFYNTSTNFIIIW
ncbi:hypothetical protein BLNAU_7058 [Blattamonas nauphoetae]|uniref:Uncharacterized protein n=1 Tax=Blattamonas nauphoetae TaxID=2049346 RepID=A0ABQ9Y2B1_9EUKA|nr:hypothetical protein BLNAU_7058 [Blattamonas nauphoetae]